MDEKHHRLRGAGLRPAILQSGRLPAHHGGFHLILPRFQCGLDIFNDVAAMSESDWQHPVKKNRPIASGKLPLPVAWTAGIALAVVSLPLGYILSPEFFAVLLVYFLLIVAYSLWLKHFAILDVLVISAGFVLRVHAGVTLITVERFSPWLHVLTTLFALYIGFGKRRSELALLTHGAGAHRKVLDGYTLPLLDQYITIVSGMTIVVYAL